MAEVGGVLCHQACLTGGKHLPGISFSKSNSVHMKLKSLLPKPILAVTEAKKNPLLSCEGGEVLEKIFRKSTFSPRLAARQGAGCGDRAGCGGCAVVSSDSRCHGAPALGQVPCAPVHFGPQCLMAPGATVGLTLPPAWDTDLEPRAHQGRTPPSPEL